MLIHCRSILGLVEFFRRSLYACRDYQEINWVYSEDHDIVGFRLRATQQSVDTSLSLHPFGYSTLKNHKHTHDYNTCFSINITNVDIIFIKSSLIYFRDSYIILHSFLFSAPASISILHPLVFPHSSISSYTSYFCSIRFLLLYLTLFYRVSVYDTFVKVAKEKAKRKDRNSNNRK